MRIVYDVETSIVRIRLNDRKMGESNELMAGIIVDVDAKGRAIAFGILDASELIENPKSVALEVMNGAMPVFKKG